jgi:MoxR-like ATPase
LIGTQIYNPRDGQFTVKKGPLFTNLLLADEINRAPSKVQSALLEAMQEHQVTIGEQAFPLPAPFLVLATQNPIEQEGTYPLPEAQLDRFMFTVRVDYPSLEEEEKILEATTTGERAEVRKVLSALRAHKARQVTAALKAPRAPRVLQDPMGSPAIKASRALKALPERLIPFLPLSILPLAF